MARAGDWHLCSRIINTTVRIASRIRCQKAKYISTIPCFVWINEWNGANVLPYGLHSDSSSSILSKEDLFDSSFFIILCVQRSRHPGLLSDCRNVDPFFLWLFFCSTFPSPSNPAYCIESVSEDHFSNDQTISSEINKAISEPCEESRIRITTSIFSKNSEYRVLCVTQSLQRC